MDRPTIQEQLDACRSAADAVSDPDLRALAEALPNDAQLSSQLENQLAADRAILEKLNDVQTPSKLMEQLRVAFRQGAERNDRYRSRMPEITGRAAAPRRDRDLLHNEIEPGRKILTTRRRHLRRLIGVATVVCIAIAFILVFNSTPGKSDVGLSEAEFASRSVLLCTSDQKKSQPANSSSQPTLAWEPRELPFVSGVTPASWKEVNSNFAGNCVIWEINNPQHARTYLLMTKSPWKANMLPSVVSRTPIHNSGGWSAGAWRSNGIAYALVVEGNATAYGALIQRQAIAQLSRSLENPLK